jgi:nucleotide-binding universal stress UspA family protein
MYRTILVPLDGSSLAERALPWAQRLAAAADGRLILLRVVRGPPPSAAGEPLREGVPRHEAEAYLHRLARRLGTTPVDPVVLEGDAAQTILGESARRGIELIVMSTHGRAGIGRWISGSVADAVMRQAGVPVLLVPAACASGGWPTDRAPRILVPLDCSPLSEAVLPGAAGLAAPSGAELILLSVTPHLVAADLYGRVYVDYEGPDRAARRRYLEGVARGLRAAGRAVRTRDGFGPVAAVIGDVAREEGVDLIAIATHGRGGATRLVLGSVALGVVQGATVPVLVVRPAEVRRGEAPPAAPQHAQATTCAG